jgi:hypothetical protein
MLTLAEIKSINITENKCEVHIPIFDVPGTFNKTVLTAAINITPGVHSGYEVGDTVIVSFVDEAINKPIVLGKLYLGVGEEVSNRGIVSCDRLEVGQQATIPVTTELTFTGEPDTFIGVEGGYSSYKSILDIIDVLHTHTLNINSINRSVGADVDLRSAEARALALRVKDSFAEVETATQESIAEARAEVDGLLQQVNGSVAEVNNIVTTHSTTIQNITTWQGDASKALSTVENKTTEHEAKFTALAAWQNDTVDSIAEVKETANEAKAELLSIASWQENVESDVEAIATIRQTAEQAAATTDILTSWCGEGETLTTKLTQLATQDSVVNQISAAKGDINAEFILGAFENDSGSTESFATLVADKIEFEGKELNIKVPAANLTGDFAVGGSLSVGGFIFEDGGYYAGTVLRATIGTYCSDLTISCGTKVLGAIPTPLDNELLKTDGFLFPCLTRFGLMYMLMEALDTDFVWANTPPVPNPPEDVELPSFPGIPLPDPEPFTNGFQTTLFDRARVLYMVPDSSILGGFPRTYIDFGSKGLDWSPWNNDDSPTPV